MLNITKKMLDKASELRNPVNILKSLYYSVPGGYIVEKTQDHSGVGVALVESKDEVARVCAGDPAVIKDWAFIDDYDFAG